MSKPDFGTPKARKYFTKAGRIAEVSGTWQNFAPPLPMLRDQAKGHREVMFTAREENPTSFEGRTFIVGREGHIFLGDDSVSRHHAEIIFKDGRIRLRDLDSTNGIYLVRNNRAVRIREEYVDLNQPIIIGRHQCTVQGLLRALDMAGAIAS